LAIESFYQKKIITDIFNIFCVTAALARCRTKETLAKKTGYDQPLLTQKNLRPSIFPGHSSCFFWKEFVMSEEATMGDTKRGKVRWFNDARGYGFIIPEGGGADVIVHYSVIRQDGHKTLKDDEKVTYQAENTPRGMRAIWVERQSHIIPSPSARTIQTL